MLISRISVIAISLLLAACVAPAKDSAMPTSDETAMAKNMAHVHMGHVTDSWGDTPDEMGLLPTAIAEAEIAVQHAGFAAEQLDNLEWMQTHAKHVLHAVDPSAIAEGPGLGYGVKNAAGGVAKHIGFAAESDAATENVKLHAVHVATSADNTLWRVDEVARYAWQVLAASTAAEAAPAAKQMLRHATQLLDGRDANGDGNVTWQQDEGGLRASEEHMGFMRAGENL
jgi:hypothetical protein